MKYESATYHSIYSETLTRNTFNYHIFGTCHVRRSLKALVVVIPKEGICVHVHVQPSFDIFKRMPYPTFLPFGPKVC